MKSIPPPLPKNVTVVHTAPSQTLVNGDNNQTAFMLGGLVALLLLILGLLILIASLMGSGDAASNQGSGDAGTGGDAGFIGETRGGADDGEANKDRDASQPNDSSANKPKAPSPHPESAPEHTPESTTAPATQSTNPEEESPEAGSESPENTSAAAEVEPKELPKGTRVIPLFSEPSATSAPTLESSNPFLDAGKASSIVFVIDKSSSMSEGLGRVIKALNEAIDKLGGDQEFQLIFFDDSPRQNPNFSGLLKATKRNKDAMAKWIKDAVSANGSTEPLAAVRIAIDLKPKRIVILSDGEFNPQYVETITQYNSPNPKERIRIDCIGLNEVVESLRQIAKQNGPGIYFQAR